MLPVKTLMKRIRRVVHDTDAITYDDDEIIDVINQGVRYIRRIIADNKPEILTDGVVSGMIGARERSVELPYRPLLLLYVRTGSDVASSEETFSSDKIYHNYNLIYHNKTPIYSKQVVFKYKTLRIQEANISEIYGDMARDGVPEVYYITGDRTVNFYPTPKVDTFYEILAVPDFEDLTAEDNTPLLNEYDNLIVEFANLRLSTENEYDISTDSQIFSMLQSQILRLLHIPPTGVTVQSYWGPTMEQYGKPTRRMW